ncbi:MAG TPA: hypothetical protein VN256_12885 [Pyrinomonadaceae bacterium]|nr:hypothetical protein [Pyrinomonadaceae bacterium]
MKLVHYVIQFSDDHKGARVLLWLLALPLFFAWLLLAGVDGIRRWTQ